MRMCAETNIHLFLCNKREVWKDSFCRKLSTFLVALQTHRAISREVRFAFQKWLFDLDEEEAKRHQGYELIRGYLRKTMSQEQGKYLDHIREQLTGTPHENDTGEQWAK